jgi:PTH1 family peptidyl-tRNA hydrolase
MRLIVGLGNVGSRYAGNRHNVGFMIVDRLAEELGATWKEESKLKAFMATGELEGEKVLLAKPTTLMNGSGESVQRLMQFYKLALSDLTVIYDDLDTEFGQTRRRESGSSGGHNGVQSIIDHIGSDFERLRVGISMNDRSVEPSEVYVLRNFNPDEVEQLPAIIEAAIKEL